MSCVVYRVLCASKNKVRKRPGVLRVGKSGRTPVWVGPAGSGGQNIPGVAEV